MTSPQKDFEKIKTTLEKRKAKAIHIAVPDLDAGIRERRVSAEQLEGALGSGATFCNVLHQWDLADTVFLGGPYVGETIAGDPSSIRHYPFEPDAAWLIADFTGPSAETSTRRVLQAQIARAASLGLTVQTAFEFETLIFRETAESLRDKGFATMESWAPDNRCWDGLTAAIHGELIAELQATLEASEIGLFGLGMELGKGCLEATLRATDPLRAADDALFFKLATKAFFRRKGMSASFMAQADAGSPGLSGHIALSLHDKAGRALFRGGDGSAPTEPARHFIGGVLKLLPELIALPLHSVNAYRRLSPGNWAPRLPTWGVSNYTTAIRAVPGDHPSARLEFRIPGSDVNPYLGLAMFLGAGLWGMERKIEPPAPIVGDGREAKAKPLPRDLHAAAEALAASKAAREIYGSTFIERFALSRLHEHRSLLRAVSAAERARYFETV
jgi:glutamine synthetase